jgi:glycine hydroxymethyltransferase
MIVAGASAYSRIIDFKKLRAIADGVGAYLMADMAHIAGLVATGFHPSPVPYCEFVTSTTHKTLRGPRGGVILSQERFAADIAKQIFPGIQGGPLMHTIAAKAVCFHEALQPSFKVYQEQVIRNAQTMAARTRSQGPPHRLRRDRQPPDAGRPHQDRRDRQGRLRRAGQGPDHRQQERHSLRHQRSPFVTSGIRIGSPAVTTRGMKEAEMKAIAGFITEVLKDPGNEKNIEKVRKQVLELTARFPVP